MNPAAPETTWRRVRRAVFGFLTGLSVTIGVVWASHLGLEDRSTRDQRTALDLSAACVLRDGPTAVAYFGGSASPTGWRCARVVDDAWQSQSISPDEGCELLHGRRSEAEPADATSPFAWWCRR